MEVWDLYDIQRNKTGKTMIRGEQYHEGDLHIVIHACIFSSDGKMLIQQRQSFKEGWPNLWDITMGGSAISGETSQMGATRELKEELGIDVELTGVRPYFTINFSKGFDDYYLIEKDINLDELKLQYEEVQNAKWATRQEIEQLMASGQFVPYQPGLIELIYDMRKHRGAIRK